MKRERREEKGREENENSEKGRGGGTVRREKKSHKKWREMVRREGEGREKGGGQVPRDLRSCGPLDLGPQILWTQGPILRQHSMQDKENNIISLLYTSKNSLDV